MATKKKDIETPSIEEFENWTDENETEAIEQLGESFKIHHIIKGGVFWVLAPHGRIYKLPMALSMKDFEVFSNAKDDVEGMEQVKQILSMFAGEDQAKLLESEPMQVMANILNDYGKVIVASQGASLGKSETSSPASMSMGE